MQHEYCRCLCVRGGLGDEALPMQSQRDPQKVIVLQMGLTWRAPGFAPTSSLTLLPLLKTRKVGI